MPAVLIDIKILKTLVAFADRRFNNADITTDSYMAVPNAIAEAKNAMEAPVLPTIAANITGGVLQGWSSNVPAELYCLDFDIENLDPEDFVQHDGSDVHIISTCGEINTAFVDEIRALYDKQGDQQEACIPEEVTDQPQASDHPLTHPTADETARADIEAGSNQDSPASVCIGSAG